MVDSGGDGAGAVAMDQPCMDDDDNGAEYADRGCMWVAKTAGAGGVVIGYAPGGFVYVSDDDGAEGCEGGACPMNVP